MAIAAADAPEEPAGAGWRGTADAVDDAGELASELLPDGVDQQHGAIVEDNLTVAARLGGEVERARAGRSVMRWATRSPPSPESGTFGILRRRGSRDAEHGIGVHRLSGFRLPGNGDGQQAMPVHFE